MVGTDLIGVRRAAWCGCFLAWLSGLGLSLSAQEPPLEPEIAEQLLQRGWQARADRRAEADAFYAQAPLKSWELEYAHALALISQGRNREALLAARRLHGLRPNDADVARLWLWLAAVNRDYVAALNASIQVAKQVELTPRGRDSARLIGQLHGFLQGATRDAPDEARRRQTRVAVEAALPAALLPAFQQGRDDALRLHAQFQNDEQQLAIRLDQEAEAARQQELLDLQQRQADNQQAKDQLAQWRQMVLESANNQSQSLRESDWQLIEEGNRLGYSANQVGRDLSWMYWELLWLDRHRRGPGGDRDRGRGRRHDYRDWLGAQLALSTIGLGWNLNALQGQLSAVAWQRLNLAMRHHQLQQQLAVEDRRIQDQERKLLQAQRRIESRILQAQIARRSSSGEQSLRAQAASFSKFAPLSLDQERDWFLRSIGRAADQPRVGPREL